MNPRDGRERPYLSDRHATHAGVQDAGARAGAHLAGEGEPLLPVDTVGLHRLPGRAGHTDTRGLAGQRRRWGTGAQGGRAG